MMSSPRITTAPIGSSSLDAASRACASAAAIPVPRPPSPVPGLGTDRLSCLLERQRVPIFSAVHAHPIALGVLALQHPTGERSLQQPLDRALQRPGLVHR